MREGNRAKIITFSGACCHQLFVNAHNFLLMATAPYKQRYYVKKCHNSAGITNSQLIQDTAIF
ncbi:MAG: hypothetical protein EBZ77_10960 [Chitinophagia bacterium]|nr:hypothetical protein [Chitinophagia bacterium]